MATLDTQGSDRSSATGARVLAVLPAVLIGALIVGGGIWAIPGRSRTPLAETAVWSLLVLTSFVGWGSLLRFAVAPRERVDVGLRAAWGAAVLCFVGGVLMVPALMVRTSALVLVEIGLGLALVSLAREWREVRHRARFIGRFVRREPALSLLGLGVAGLVALQGLSAIADWHTNPYDDDIAYLAFLKKLSDTGTLLEPFSFRRLSAYGGQTFFLELLSVRAAPSQGNTFDRCVCFILVVLLMVGHRARGRRPSFLFVAASIAMLATMQSIAINTASYWSGAAFFLALFRTMAWLEDRDRSSAIDVGRAIAPWKRALPVAFVGVAACTLRQNYLTVPALTLAASYAVRLRRGSGTIRDRLAEPVIVAAMSVALLVPWFIVSWQSNRTFLYPVLPGTFHPPLALNATGWNVFRELALHAGLLIDGLPVQTLGCFVAAIAFVRESGARRPLGALCVGVIGSEIALVHGLTQSDAQNIGRYAFSFVVALVLAVVLTTGTARLTSKIGRLEIAAGLVVFAILAQIVASREKLAKDYSLRIRNIEALAFTPNRVRETDPPQVKLYAERLQGAVPPGERLAVMVDEPHYLDFARNPIWNLDMPGYASLPPGMPSFKGSEALEQYFKGLGVRWLMFVLPEYSRYHYRREYFIELFVHEQEIWRTYAPYLVDFIDSVLEIRKRHREAYSERGIVVIDLQESR